MMRARGIQNKIDRQKAVFDIAQDQGDPDAQRRQDEVAAASQRNFSDPEKRKADKAGRKAAKKQKLTAKKP